MRFEHAISRFRKNMYMCERIIFTLSILYASVILNFNLNYTIEHRTTNWFVVKTKHN